MFSSIVLAVMFVAAIVASVAAVYARMSAKDAAKAAKAMQDAEMRMRMSAAFEVAVKQAQLMDAGIKAAEVRLGLRAKTGTRLGYGIAKN